MGPVVRNLCLGPAFTTSYTGTSPLCSSDLVQRPTVAIQRTSSPVSNRTIASDKLRQVHALSLVDDIDGVLLIDVLFLACSPPEVSPFVVSIIVDPVDLEPEAEGIVPTFERSDVVDEGDRVVELVRETNSPTTVPAVFEVEAILTAPTNCEPFAPDPLVGLIGHPPPQSHDPGSRGRLLCA